MNLRATARRALRRDRDLAAGLAPLLVPWTAVASGGAVTLVFPWGLASASPPPLHLVPLSTFLLSLTGGLPAYLRAWPLSVLFYAVGLVTAAWPWVRPRTTAAVLAAAGLTHLAVSVGIWRTGRVALPLGTVALWAVAYHVAARPRPTA